MTAYYNEIDPYAAQWLRNLIAAGHIAAGDVDERSIIDVRPSDLAGYQQAHFFAGIGGWSYALRLAGWPDDRPVWTGSCPCQPFSAAGAGKAADDERHLWPAWFPLIAECRPAIIFGEQVEAAIGWGWIDAVFADLESQGYACGTAVLPACGVGAPHIRQRLWFVAESNGGDASAEGLQRGGEHGQRTQNGRSLPLADTGHDDGATWSARREQQSATPIGERIGSDSPVGLANAANGNGRGRERTEETGIRPYGERRRRSASSRVDGGMAFASGVGRQRGQTASPRHDHDRPASERAQGEHGPSVTGSHWADCDWLPCTDRKARPVEPGTFPLATGIPGRVGRLRAYGNAIVAQIAAEFIGAASEAIG